MDEVIISCKNKTIFTNIISDMLQESISEVSEMYLLRRELGCDVQVGKRYSEIH